MNYLSQEKSPYLLQHQDNPVHWYAWGEAAFKAAREQQKPIFLSVGYSTCHWCHVMAHESFEDAEVAALLNEHFISIKLDREERPDVDDIYMGAIHAMGQRGGWPLSMFLTPELTPFFGGTYFPKPQFMQVLDRLQQLWRDERPKIMESGKSLTEHLRAQKQAVLREANLDEGLLKRFLENSQATYDTAWGGFSGAPKFPHATQLSVLLRLHKRFQSDEALQMVVHSLERMARGGLYDHLGGGFARYSVDNRWEIPHFEKMLYDNALLVYTYLEAYQITGIETFAEVARETLNYVLDVMTHPEGGFYSAEDADSEGEEGKFYVWTTSELEKILTPEEFAHLAKVYSVTPQGNFEGGTNHFNLSDDFSWEEKNTPLMKSIRQKLFEVREQRIHPHKDDKVLTSWNGLMIRAMAKGYRVLGDAKYLVAAHRAAAFIRKNLVQAKNSEQKLLARYRDGESRFAARLEDYAYLIQALIELYQSDFNPEVLQWAEEFQNLQQKYFWDKESGAYFYTDGEDENLLLRAKEGMDGALPNANGVSVESLLKLFALTWKPEYQEFAQKTLSYFASPLSEYPHAFAAMVSAFELERAKSQELAIILPKEATSQDKKAEIQDSTPQKSFQFSEALGPLGEHFSPHLSVALGEVGADYPPLLSGKLALTGHPTYYLCQDQTCEAPSNEWKFVWESLAR